MKGGGSNRYSSLYSNINYSGFLTGTLGETYKEVASVKTVWPSKLSIQAET